MGRSKKKPASRAADMPVKPLTAAHPASDGCGLDINGCRRVVIESVRPELDCGRFPIKRVVGQSVVVEAEVFADGHDEIAGVIRYRHERDQGWTDMELSFVENDRWRACFDVREQGIYYYTVTAWIDHFRSWQRDMRKRIAA